MTLAELRPCPFCGDKFVHAELIRDGLWGVHCPNGQCPSAGNFPVTDFSEAEVIAAWNRRQEAPAHPRVDGSGLDLDELEKVARGATQGDWQELHNLAGPMGVTARDAMVCWLETNKGEHANALHIATFDPPTVLSLIAVARGLG